jgi:hypothetical protein
VKSQKQLFCTLTALLGGLALGSLALCAPVIPAKAVLIPLCFHYDAPPRKERIINFPKDYSLGQIAISTVLGTDVDAGMKGAARGKVVVPAKQYSWFIPAHHFYLNPSSINVLDPDSIDKISLTAASLDDSEDGLCDRSIRYVSHLKGLIGLDLDRSDATDAGAKDVDKLPNLQRFSAFFAMLDGSCFKYFSNLKKLRDIEVQGNNIKDENLKYLAAIPNLECLDLSQNCISDIGIKGLANSPQLKLLNVSSNPKITDASVDTLLTLKKLNNLIIAGTSLTISGITRLKALSIASITLPNAYYSEYEMKKLHQAFPKSIISFPRRGAKVTPEMNNLYGPLH